MNKKIEKEFEDLLEYIGKPNETKTPQKLDFIYIAVKNLMQKI